MLCVAQENKWVRLINSFFYSNVKILLLGAENKLCEAGIELWEILESRCVLIDLLGFVRQLSTKVTKESIAK